MASARFWKKWLRLGGWWLRRQITSVSFQPIVFRQSRLRALLPNDTTLVPCAAAKRLLAHLRRCALALGTLERSADTLPNLPRRNASPTRNATRKPPSAFLPFGESFGELAARDLMENQRHRCHKKDPKQHTRLGSLSCCLKIRLIWSGSRGVGGWGAAWPGLTQCALANNVPNSFNIRIAQRSHFFREFRQFGNIEIRLRSNHAVVWCRHG